MVAVSAVRRALAARLETIPGLSVTGHFGSNVVTPAAVLTPGVPGAASTSRPAVDYQQSFGGGHPMSFTVRVLVGLQDDESATKTLDAYLDSDGAHSVYAALEADQESLVDEDGEDIADFVTVPACLQYGPIEANGVLYLGAEWAVTVNAA
ncbi:hypothetical protein ACF07Q_28605 [Nocardiopsis dassonvillei]|uniref:hypothetical protein n=1 Tax=Nocardiopsis dassonvillei TaxID=2014 RepID=UPI0036FA7396